MRGAGALVSAFAAGAGLIDRGQAYPFLFEKGTGCIASIRIFTPLNLWVGAFAAGLRVRQGPKTSLLSRALFVIDKASLLCRMGPNSCRECTIVVFFTHYALPAWISIEATVAISVFVGFNAPQMVSRVPMYEA